MKQKTSKKHLNHKKKHSATRKHNKKGGGFKKKLRNRFRIFTRKNKPDPKVTPENSNYKSKNSEKNIREKIEDNLNLYKSEYTKKLQENKSEYTKKLQENKSEYTKNVEENKSEYKKNVEEIESEYKKNVEEIESEHKKNVEEIESEYKKNVEENKSEYIKNLLSGLNFGESKEEKYLKHVSFAIQHPSLAGYNGKDLDVLIEQIEQYAGITKKNNTVNDETKQSTEPNINTISQVNNPISQV